MIEGFYLAFGFALITVLSREGTQKWAAQAAFFSGLKLTFSLTALTGLHMLSLRYLWGPAGRVDFSIASFLLLAFLIDEGMERVSKGPADRPKIRFFVRQSLLALIAFSIWIQGPGGAIGFLGFALPLASSFVEWLLEGFRARLRLSFVPRVLEGEPILLVLAALLFLAFGWFVNMEGWVTLDPGKTQ